MTLRTISARAYSRGCEREDPLKEPRGVTHSGRVLNAVQGEVRGAYEWIAYNSVSLTTIIREVI